MIINLHGNFNNNFLIFAKSVKFDCVHLQVITEKGVSDLAQHFLMKHGITVIRRLRKTDNLRVARATGATIVNRTEEITEKDIGHGAGLFEVKHFSTL